jgi:hypothetical protein
MTAWDLTNYLSPHSPIQTNNCLNRYVIKHYYCTWPGISWHNPAIHNYFKAMQSIACYFIIVWFGQLFHMAYCLRSHTRHGFLLIKLTFTTDKIWQYWGYFISVAHTNLGKLSRDPQKDQPIGGIHSVCTHNTPFVRFFGTPCPVRMCAYKMWLWMTPPPTPSYEFY